MAHQFIVEDMCLTFQNKYSYYEFLRLLDYEGYTWGGSGEIPICFIAKQYYDNHDTLALYYNSSHIIKGELVEMCQNRKPDKLMRFEATRDGFCYMHNLLEHKYTCKKCGINICKECYILEEGCCATCSDEIEEGEDN